MTKIDFKLHQRVQSARKPERTGPIKEIFTRGDILYHRVQHGAFQETYREDEIDPEGTKIVWRDGLAKPGDEPTVGEVVIHAEDRHENRGIFTVFVHHVDTFHGKGFKAVVRSDGGTCTGEIFLGVSERCYERAREEGARLLDSEVRRIDASIEEHRLASIEHQRKESET